MGNKNLKKRIIKKARDICKKDFMKYPDFDKNIETSFLDALTIILAEHIQNDDIGTTEIYDFLDSYLTTKKAPSKPLQKTLKIKITLKEKENE